MRIEAVVFDMDGLMLDSEMVYVATSLQAEEELGYTPSKELAVSTMGGTNAQWKADVKEYYGEDFPIEKFSELSTKLMDEWYDTKGIPVKTGLVELLKYLKQVGIPCAVASSTDTEKAMRMLRKAEVDGYFADFVFGDMIERSKPAPDIFLAAAAALGKDPTRCMGLEDSRNGLTAAKAAGMYTVMVPDMLQPDEALLEMIDGCVTSLHDIIPLIERLNA